MISFVGNLSTNCNFGSYPLIIFMQIHNKNGEFTILG